MSLSPYWLVADMDGTLTPTPTKAGGQYLRLGLSPCFGPLDRFIRAGGNLCVVSTAGRRMMRQIFDELKPALFSSPSAGRLAISGYSGAAMFFSDRVTQAMVEDVEYRRVALRYAPEIQAMIAATSSSESSPTASAAATAVNKGVSGGDKVSEEKVVELETAHHHHFRTTTIIDAENVLPVRDIGIRVVRSFVHAAAEAGPLQPPLALLSAKYQQPYKDLIAQRAAYIAQAGKENSSSNTSAAIERFNQEVLSVENLTLHGRFLTETRDALVDIQTIPGTDVAVQFSVLGIPMAVFSQYFTQEIVAELAEYGVYAKSQPNSVAIAKRGIDKALCVEWLVRHVDGFRLDAALAFGDIPASVDKPLTAYPNMGFVSLSTTPAADPPAGAHCVHVGHEELGTAAFLEAMLADLLPHTAGSAATTAAAGILKAAAAADQPPVFPPEAVASWASRARSAMAAAPVVSASPTTTTSAAAAATAATEEEKVPQSPSSL